MLSLRSHEKHIPTVLYDFCLHKAVLDVSVPSNSSELQLNKTSQLKVVLPKEDT